eukprot:TRINITY_DN15853_c0_g1_i1.p1 TRINITY_DN15853_c0_g1~~TRINITY_DN15853_c0_g1_i1.p1  ORF type:complete len:202 (+),score=49.39 TRINITY_DN15853_c0_g1_i1:49-654(+)
MPVLVPIPIVVEIRRDLDALASNDRLSARSKELEEKLLVITEANVSMQLELLRHQEELEELRQLVLLLRKENEILAAIDADLKRREQRVDAAEAKAREHIILVDLTTECFESLQQSAFNDTRRDDLTFGSLDDLIDGMLDEHMLTPHEKKLLVAKLESAGLHDLIGLRDVLRARRLYPRHTTEHRDDVCCQDVISKLPEPD